MDNSTPANSIVKGDNIDHFILQEKIQLIYFIFLFLFIVVVVYGLYIIIFIQQIQNPV